MPERSSAFLKYKNNVIYFRKNRQKVGQYEKIFKLLRKIGYLIAFSLILYPVVSNYINQQHSSTIATDYDQKVSHLSEKEEAKMIKKLVNIIKV